MGAAAQERGVLPRLRPSRRGPPGPNRGACGVDSCRPFGSVRLGFALPAAAPACEGFLGVVGEAAAATTPEDFASSSSSPLRRRSLWRRREDVGNLGQEDAISRCSSEWRLRLRQGGLGLCTRRVGGGGRLRRGSFAFLAMFGVGIGCVPGPSPADEPQRRRPLWPYMRLSEALMRDEARPIQGRMEARPPLRRSSGGSGGGWRVRVLGVGDSGVLTVFFCLPGAFLQLCRDMCPFCCLPCLKHPVLLWLI
jgi:hypothetical protein